MLVLTRQRDESVVIGDKTELADNIVVTIVDIRGDKVRLGISAPKQIPVHRMEVWEQIRDENKNAAHLQPTDLTNLPSGRPIPIDIVKSSILPNLKPESPSPFPRLSAEPDPFLLEAIEEAQAGLKEGGLPIGSVLVREGRIIGRGHNRRVQKGDPMAHAEIDCLTNAGRQINYRDTVLYSTLMPCHLCSGAAVQFGISRVIVGESVNFPGSAPFMKSKGIDVIDLHDSTCIEMMAKFIREHPGLWNEDIGK